MLAQAIVGMEQELLQRGYWQSNSRDLSVQNIPGQMEVSLYNVPHSQVNKLKSHKATKLANVQNRLLQFVLNAHNISLAAWVRGYYEYDGYVFLTSQTYPYDDNMNCFMIF